MLILAVDTTSRTGSLALWRDTRVTDTLVGDASHTHGERLPGEISKLLSQARVSVKDVELYAVVTGPGSFTGLRVGIAAVQGLALAQERRVVPIPALEAFALSGPIDDGRVAVWRDAQRKQVFACLFERSGERLREVLPPVSMSPTDVAREWVSSGLGPNVFIGDGVDAYSDIIRAAWPGARLVMPAPLLAPIAAAMAARHPEDAVAPHAIVPIYVRATDAELARERNDVEHRARDRRA